VALPVAVDGRACPARWSLPQDLVSSLAGRTGAVFGSIILTRTQNDAGNTLGLPPAQDLGGATFLRLTAPTGFLVSDLFAEVVPAGSCTVTTLPGAGVGQVPAQPPKYLDAGPSLTVSGPGGPRTLAKLALTTVAYAGTLGDGTPGNYLDPGTYSAAGAGGADVGAFTANVDLGPLLVWTNRSEATSVDRAAGLTVTWTGGDPDGVVQIVGSSTVGADAASLGIVAFNCFAPVSAGAFTIPPSVLLALPPTPARALFPAELSVRSESKPGIFQASGLDFGLLKAAVTFSATPTYK
jgi:hypothetical protein